MPFHQKNAYTIEKDVQLAYTIEQIVQLAYTISIIASCHTAALLPAAGAT